MAQYLDASKVQEGTVVLCNIRIFTVVPVMFGKPLLNNVLAFDHVLLQK